MIWYDVIWYDMNSIACLSSCQNRIICMGMFQVVSPRPLPKWCIWMETKRQLWWSLWFLVSHRRLQDSSWTSMSYNNTPSARSGHSTPADWVSRHGILSLGMALKTTWTFEDSMNRSLGRFGGETKVAKDGQRSPKYFVPRVVTQHPVTRCSVGRQLQYVDLWRFPWDWSTICLTKCLWLRREEDPFAGSFCRIIFRKFEVFVPWALWTWQLTISWPGWVTNELYYLDTQAKKWPRSRFQGTLQTGVLVGSMPKPFLTKNTKAIHQKT